MAKKTGKGKMADTVKLICYVILAGITIGGTIVGVDHYFAKTEDLEALKEHHIELRVEDELNSERLDIAITDDQIFQQEQHIQQMENLRVFEQRVEIPELTPMEKESINNSKIRLKVLKTEKVEKMKSYAEQRKRRDSKSDK